MLVQAKYKHYEIFWTYLVWDLKKYWLKLHLFVSHVT